MRFKRIRIRTLLIAMASAATGYAAALRYIAYMDAYPQTPIADNPFEVVAPALAIGTGTHIAVIVVLALLPRMTTRRWMIAIALVATLFATAVHLSHLADQYSAIAKYHESQGSAVSRGKNWSGSIEGRSITITYTGSGEKLKGRELAVYIWHEKLAMKYRDAAHAPGFPFNRTRQSRIEPGKAFAKRLWTILEGRGAVRAGKGHRSSAGASPSR